MKEIYALGIGHNTPVFIDLAEACGYQILGLYHYDYSKTGDEAYGFCIHGSFDDLFACESLEGKNFLLTMGNSNIRKELSDKIIAKGGKVPSLIHPASIVSKYASVSSVGVYIGPFTYIQANSRISDNVVVLSHVNISHDTTIGQGSFIAGGCMIGAYTEVEEFAFIGQHVTSISGKVSKIGKKVFIGAGSVLTKDVRDSALVVGVPAKEVNK